MNSDSEEKFLEFKWLKHRAISFGTAGTFPPPMRMMELRAELSQGKQGTVDGIKRGAIVPIFNLESVQKIPLLTEWTPEYEEEAITDRYKQELRDDAWKAAREAREANDEIRRIAYHHAKVGNIEIVNDPYANRMVKTKQGLKNPKVLVESGSKAKPNKELDKVTLNPDLGGARPTKGEKPAAIVL